MDQGFVTSLSRKAVSFRAQLLLVVVSLSLVTLSLPAAAHQPADDNWDWTCIGGNPFASPKFAGSCHSMTSADPPVHHSNANANFHYGTSVGGSWTAPINSGYLAWDQTNGHEFNFVNTASSGAEVIVTSAEICGGPSYVGCTQYGADSGHHAVESTATIKLKSTISASLRDDVAAHEFGHYVGLGHSDQSTATMDPTPASGAVTLATYDRKGRCEIYGHSHGYWGGC